MTTWPYCYYSTGLCSQRGSFQVSFHTGGAKSSDSFQAGTVNASAYGEAWCYIRRTVVSAVAIQPTVWFNQLWVYRIEELYLEVRVNVVILSGNLPVSSIGYIKSHSIHGFVTPLTKVDLKPEVESHLQLVELARAPILTLIRTFLSVKQLILTCIHRSRAHTRSSSEHLSALDQYRAGKRS